MFSDVAWGNEPSATGHAGPLCGPACATNTEEESIEKTDSPEVVLHQRWRWDLKLRRSGAGVVSGAFYNRSMAGAWGISRARENSTAAVRRPRRGSGGTVQVADDMSNIDIELARETRSSIGSTDS